MTKTNQAIIFAAEKGYNSTSCGNIISPFGKPLALKGGRSGYLSFSIKLQGSSVNIPVHRFVAFLKFGKAALEPGACSRHLNGNPRDNSRDNIAIGSHSENMMDQAEQARSRKAQIAGRGKSLSDEFWLEIEKQHSQGMSFKAIRREYGVSLSTLSFRLSKRAKKRVMPIL